MGLLAFARIAAVAGGTVVAAALVGKVVWDILTADEQIIATEEENVFVADQEEEEEVLYSNPYNNHDDQKRPYSTKSQALEVIARMKRHGRPGADRLQAYKNRERDCWYIGKSKYQ